MEEDKKSYQSLFKSTALFGGVQVFHILMSIIRVKFVAILLGTEGVGLISLYQSTLAIVSNVTGLGIDKSAVRELSMAHENGEGTKTVAVVRRWNWMTGLFGAVVVLSISAYLSRWAFDTEDYQGAFMWLSITMLMDALSKGELAIFQGLRRLRTLAKANLIGAFIGLALSIPIYYWIGKAGIVPTLILSSAASLLATTLYYRKEKIEQAPITLRESVNSGFSLAEFGVMLTLSSFIATLGTYLFNIYLSRAGGMGEVGLYQSGFNLINRYVGLVFVAMGTDYFPRLAAVSNDVKRMKELVNQQCEVALLILFPIVVTFIPTANLVVKLFLSEQFTGIVPFVQWAVIGMFFKASAWALGNVLIAKGASSLFIMTETSSVAVMLILYVAGYHMLGIEGLGIAFSLWYLFYLLMMAMVNRRKFGITFSRQTWRMNILFLSTALLQLLLMRMETGCIKYGLSSCIVLFSCYISLRMMNDRIGLSNLVAKFRKKK